MSRTTKKTDFIKIDDFRNTTYLTLQDLINAYNKLIKLEDLEEEIGCPLEVLFKALRQGYIYTLVEKDYIINLKIDEQCFFIVGCKDTNVSTTFNVYLNNYKKTWWLKKDRSE